MCRVMFTLCRSGAVRHCAITTNNRAVVSNHFLCDRTSSPSRVRSRAMYSGVVPQQPPTTNIRKVSRSTLTLAKNPESPIGYSAPPVDFSGSPADGAQYNGPSYFCESALSVPARLAGPLPQFTPSADTATSRHVSSKSSSRTSSGKALSLPGLTDTQTGRSAPPGICRSECRADRTCCVDKAVSTSTRSTPPEIRARSWASYAS